MRTLPSACWWFSKIITIVRVIAQSVPFKVATGPGPPGKRARMFSRRAWNSVQLDVEVISRYRCWVGSQP